jgi:sugar phosphate isomerase/epimerase
MPTVGFTTTTFTDQPTALPGLEFAVEHGFHALELSGKHLWPEVMSATEMAELQSVSKRHGIGLSIHFPTRYSPGSPDEATRLECVAALRATIGTARELGTKIIVVHPGPAHSPGGDPDAVSEQGRAEARQRVRESILAVASDVERAGVSLCLENVPFSPGLAVRSYAEQLEIVDGINSPAVGLTLDAGHAWGSGGIAEAFAAFGSRVRHLHIHDATPEGPHLAIGVGNVDFAAHADAIRAFPHTMIMELIVDGEGHSAPATGRAKPALLSGREDFRRWLGNVD